MPFASRSVLVQLWDSTLHDDDGDPNTPDVAMGWTTIAAVTAKSLTLDGGTVEAAAGPLLEVLAVPGEYGLSISVEGLTDDIKLRDYAMKKTADDGVFLTTGDNRIQFVIPKSDEAGTVNLGGTFVMTAYEESGVSPDGVVTFSATFESGGDWALS